MSRFFQKPRWTVCYQGRTDYEVGPPVARQGSPSVTIRHGLSAYRIHYLNNPEEFWKLDIASVGVILWKFCPWLKEPYHHFPDPEIAGLFPGYPLARCDQDWRIEVAGEFPQLVATKLGIEPRSEYDATEEADWNKILWQGTAPEMTKALWFEVIFPFCHPAERSRIVHHLVRKQIEIPTHPSIPDAAYIYCVELGKWQVRLSRTYLPTQFYNNKSGWVDLENQATVFYQEDNAKQTVERIREIAGGGSRSLSPLLQNYEI